MTTHMQAQSGDHVRALGRVALGSRLKRLSERLLSDVARVYETQGIDFKPPWFPLFSLVAEAGERGVTVVEAARQLQLTHPAVSQFAKEMTKAGLLSARADRKDGRRHSLHPTKKFREVHARAQVIWRALDVAINELFAEAGVNLIADLARIEEALNRQSSQRRILSKLQHSLAVTCVAYDSKYKSHFKRLNLQWIKEFFRIEPGDRAVLDDPQGQILDQGGEILIAVSDGKVLGVCALKKLEKTRYELCKMAVEKNSRDKGIGRELMNAVIARARGIGAKELVLETSSKLTAAIKLYEKFGFKHVPLAAHKDYDRTDTAMRLVLTS
jgi:ribosomal protein S18 acetylase RimI-like enzyme/DNA-binding MarR family transcriptional regulator